MSVKPTALSPAEALAKRRALQEKYSIFFSALGALAFSVVSLLHWFSPLIASVVLAGLLVYSAILASSKPMRAALVFAACLMPLFLWRHRWMVDVTFPGMIGVALVVAGHYGLFVYLAARLRARVSNPWAFALAAATLLAGVEFFRGRLFMSGYPWYLVGERSIDNPLATTFAPLVGMYGVNLIVCLLGAGLPLTAECSHALRQRVPPENERDGWILRIPVLLYPVGLIFLSQLSVGSGSPPLNNTSGVPVAVVQTNVPQSNKQFATPDERIQQFIDAAQMTRAANDASQRAFGEPPAFIAWPETMFPGTALNDEAVDVLRASGVGSFAMTGDMRDALLALQSSMGTPVLIGAVAMENARVVPAEDEGYVRLTQDGLYNSVFLVEDGAVAAERYDKIHLTPFGEVMPLISRSDWLEKQLLAFGAPGMSFDLDAGTEFFRFDINGVRVATPICFEATIHHICRQLVFEGGERKADILVNLTNDGWFGETDSARRDHLVLARWRAAELATPVVRAANTGASCFIDAKGRVTLAQDEGGVELLGELDTWLQGPPRVAAIRLARVVPGEGITLYGRTGDVVGWAVFLLGCGLTVLALFPTKNRANPAPAPNAVEPIPD